jgi:diketogulonate reductase-like aldo/keto reductase
MAVSSQSHCIVLNTGVHMPLLGLGTFLSKPGEVALAVKTALNLGYRHIDCAEAYDNQKEIGQALSEIWKEGKVKREDVFITSKLRAGQMQINNVHKQFEQTLQELQLSYLDLYLIHHPVPCGVGDGGVVKFQRGVCIQDIWREMEKIYDSGKVKAIGLSNFPTVLVNDLLNYARIKPAVNQIERTPYLTQKRHIEFLRSEGIEVTAFGPLGAPGLMSQRKPNIKPLMSNQVIIDIAAKKGKTIAQVLIRWGIQSKTVVIPKSITPARIEENFKVLDWELTNDEMKALDDLNTDYRYFDQDWHGVPTFT